MNEMHMNLDRIEAERQRKAFEDCRRMIEETAYMNTEELKSILFMAEYNARFAQDKGDRYIARQWQQLAAHIKQTQSA